MHRTQIYFDEDLFGAIKSRANSLGLSLSAYIRNTLKKELRENSSDLPQNDFSQFAGMWEDREISQDDIRKEAWR